MTRFDLLKRAATQIIGRKTLLLKKKSPELLIILGGVGIVYATVKACKATKVASEIIEEHDDKIEQIEQKKSVSEQYEVTEYKKEIAITHVKTVTELVRLYAPAVMIGAASFCCILGAHKIMSRRNVSLMAAYKALDETFINYRRRVINEFGADTDWKFKNGIYDEKVHVLEQDENGEVTSIKETEKVIQNIYPSEASRYARFFDYNCSEYSNSPEHNLTFLKMQERWANDLLRSRGHVFLNEVYDNLGFQRSKEGAIVGWVWNSKEGDNLISFGIHDDAVLGYMDEYSDFIGSIADNRRAFVNQRIPCVLLDFNVDGVIYDKI